MSYRRTAACVLLFSGLLFACGDDTGGTGNNADAGPGADSGPGNDGGPGTDGGQADGGPSDIEPDTPLGDPGHEVWVFMQSHLHTTGFHNCANDPLNPGPLPDGACFDPAGVTGFLQEALDNGASDMIITDHNNIDVWFDPLFAPLADPGLTRYATPLRGTEWSAGDGHMTLLFPREVVATNAEAIANGWIYAAGNSSPVGSDQEYIDVIDSVHAVGGVVMINHPELAIHVFPEDALGADGVEVGVPPNPLNDISGGVTGLQASKEARDWWHRRLFSGDRLAGTAGADHHHGAGDIPGLEAPTFGIAVNMIRVDPSLPNTTDVNDAITNAQNTIDQRSDIVIDAILRGHLMVVEDRDAAKVFIGADTDGDGRFHDARAGDCILPADFAGSSFRVRIKIIDVTSAFGSSHYNFIWWNHESETDFQWFVEVDYDTGFETSPMYEIDATDPFTIELDVPYDPAARGFFRLVLERDILGPINDTEVVTQPIYYGDWGAECDSASPLY